MLDAKKMDQSITNIILQYFSDHKLNLLNHRDVGFQILVTKKIPSSG